MQQNLFKLCKSFCLIFIGICIGCAINVFANQSPVKSPNPTEITNTESTIHQEQVYINGVRYTVVTSNSPSMVIMR